MNAITEYKEKTYITLKDGRVLTTDKSPKEVYERINANSHIFIDGEMHSKYSIVSAAAVTMDDIESLILSQPKEIQDKIRAKIKRRKEQMWEWTSIEYVRNYLSKLTS